MTTPTPRLIAFYLPQYHPIPENDRWWGEGFTDWDNVRAAQPLYDGHRQPRQPGQELGYYDPRDPHTLATQADLARRHGIQGFCFFHYWFKGQQLLQQPLQGFLSRGEPDLPFCLCWANDPWTRAWDGRDRDVLMPQDYGGPEDWEAHFRYLLPFLQDPRAIQVEGKPLFLVYRAGSIDRCAAMLRHWRSLASQAGLPGLHLVAMLTAFSDGHEHRDLGVDASCEFLPTHAFRPHGLEWLGDGFRLALHWRALKRWTPLAASKVMRIDYDLVWRRALALRRVTPTQYRGAFTGWDNSPRKGLKGVIMPDATPARYRYWLTQQLLRVRADRAQAPLLFVNAWNEWAEGAYLEPDRAFGHGFLEATRDALCEVYGGGVIDAIAEQIRAHA